MYRVCSLRLSLNFVLRIAAEKDFYLQLTVEKMHAFVVFSNKYLQPYGWSNTNFTATANYTNRKIEYDVKQLNYKPLEYKPTFYYFGNGGGIMLFV